MASIRELAACIGIIKSEISVVRDLFGHRTGAPGDLSIRDQAALLRGSFFHINLIKVGESFTDEENRVIDSNLFAMRRIFAASSVRVGIGRIAWFFASDAQVAENLDAFSVETWAEDAEDITDEFNGPPGALDLFVVRFWATEGIGAAGRSAVNGSCDHSYDLCEMTGAVAALGITSGDHERSERTFAHETAHYLGLDHLDEVIVAGRGLDETLPGDDDEIGTIFNLMSDPDDFDIDPLESVDLTPAQGRTMRSHCFIIQGCKP